jgi:hypothetical protein
MNPKAKHLKGETHLNTRAYHCFALNHQFYAKYIKGSVKGYHSRIKNLLIHEIREIVPELLCWNTLRIVLTNVFDNLLIIQQINKLNHPGFTKDGRNKCVGCTGCTLCNHPEI